MELEKKTAFDEALLHSVDAALNTLGTSVKESIFLGLKMKNRISKEEIPGRIGEFMQALEGMIGYGARVVEKLVIAGLVGSNQIAPNNAQGKRLVEIVRTNKSR